MIRNIVFDIGGVLLEFEPAAFLAERFGDPAVSQRLNRSIFESELWIEMDRGTITLDEARAEIVRRQPDLQREVDMVLSDWESILLPMDESVVVLEELRSAGYPLYALSNFPGDAFQKVYRLYDFFQLFDGLVISAHINHVKPEREIYLHLLDKYNLTAEESLFIDDREANLMAAQELGFHAVKFVDASRLRKSLEELKIL